MIFPLAASVLIVTLNGRVVRSYQPALLVSGHVIAPIDPFLTASAKSITFSRGYLIVRRGDRFAQIPLQKLPVPASWNGIYVQIVPALRTLGAQVSYDPSRAQLSVDFPATPVATPSPFNPAVAPAAPTVVFTPSPIPTPRPVVTGKPSPRRTPLPCCTQSSRLH